MTVFIVRVAFTVMAALSAVFVQVPAQQREEFCTTSRPTDANKVTRASLLLFYPSNSVS